eukprot:947964-Amphidinium_carterae.1
MSSTRRATLPTLLGNCAYKGLGLDVLMVTTLSSARQTTQVASFVEDLCTSATFFGSSHRFLNQARVAMAAALIPTMGA